MKYHFPNNYSLTQLSDPTTYDEDDNLARLCRQVIAPKLNFPSGEAKQKLLSGQLPKIVRTHVDELHQQYLNLMVDFNKAQSDLPPDYTMVTEFAKDGAYALLKPTGFDADLDKRIKRLGGHWCTKTWRIPLNKIRSLKRVLQNHSKSPAANHATMDDKMELLNNIKSLLPESLELVGTEEKGDATLVLLKPEYFDFDLHPRIKRIGGYWCGLSYKNRRLWVIPIERVGSLKRVFDNHQLAKQTPEYIEQAKKEAEERARREQAQKERKEQWAKEKEERKKQWAKEKEERKLQWAKEKQERKLKQARVQRERVKVTVGEYDIGDKIFNKPITRFGEEWIEMGGAPNEYFVGQLWELCECKREEPVYMMGSLGGGEHALCSKCINERYGTEVRYCYAYFS